MRCPILFLRNAFLYSKNPVLMRTYLLISTQEDLAQQLVEEFSGVFSNSMKTSNRKMPKYFIPTITEVRIPWELPLQKDLL